MIGQFGQGHGREGKCLWFPFREPVRAPERDPPLRRGAVA
jgi:hypothetical protein